MGKWILVRTGEKQTGIVKDKTLSEDCSLTMINHSLTGFENFCNLLYDYTD